MPHNSNVGQLMRSVSAVVARPGTGTTSEAIASGCPLLLNCLGGIMPQERITVTFCLKHNVAKPIRSPGELARTIAAWKEHPELPDGIRRAMTKACPPAHPLDIVQMIADVRADNIAAARIPIVEAARAAQPAERRALEKNRLPSRSTANADSP